MPRTDYPKIDIYVDGVYKASTTWSRTLKDAKAKYLKAYPSAGGKKVQVAYAKKRNPVKKQKSLSVFDRHQLKIARDTLKMSDAGARIMGGMTKAEARAVIARLTGQSPKENPADDTRWGKIVAKYDLKNGVVLKVQKQLDYDDWVVRYFKNGKYSEAKSSFHGDDKQDALNTAAVYASKFGQKGYKNNPVASKKPVEIYDTCLEIRAIKGGKSNWPKEHFKHSFSQKSKAKIFGNPDGSLTIKSAVGKKLWKNFQYDESEAGR